MLKEPDIVKNGQPVNNDAGTKPSFETILSGVAGGLAALYIKEQLEEGRDLVIPSLGLVLKAEDYNRRKRA